MGIDEKDIERYNNRCYKPQRTIDDEERVKLKALYFHGIKYDTEISKPTNISQWYNGCNDAYYINVTFVSSRKAIDFANKKQRELFHEDHPGQIYPPMSKIEWRGTHECEKCGGNLIVKNKDRKIGKNFAECAYCGSMVKEIGWDDNVRLSGEERGV